MEQPQTAVSPQDLSPRDITSKDMSERNHTATVDMLDLPSDLDATQMVRINASSIVDEDDLIVMSKVKSKTPRHQINSPDDKSQKESDSAASKRIKQSLLPTLNEQLMAANKPKRNMIKGVPQTSVSLSNMDDQKKNSGYQVSGHLASGYHASGYPATGSSFDEDRMQQVTSEIERDR